MDRIYANESAMGHIICVASQKGGTGKTTTAVNLAACFALLEKHTLLVDCDPLGNATTGLGIDKSLLSYDIFDALTGRASIREIVSDTALECLQALPSRASLHYLEDCLEKTPQSMQLLRNALRPISSEYEVIIIDSPPSFGFLTQCALAAADFLLLPLQRTIYAFEGLSQFLVMARDIREKLNPSLKIMGIFYTMCRPDMTGGDPVSEFESDFFKQSLLNTKIPWDNTLTQAADLGKPAVLMDLLSKGAAAYMNLSLELIPALGGKPNPFPSLRPG